MKKPTLNYFTQPKLGLVAVALSLLSACGGGSSGGDISGTITSPQSLAGSFVVACHIPSGTQCDLGHQKTLVQQFPTGTGTSSAYTLKNVTPGNYYIIAWYDQNNNSSIDQGDAASCLGGNTCTVVTPPRTNVNISFN